MEQERWEQLIDGGRARAGALSTDSPTRQIATPEWFDRLSAADPPYGTDAPPLLLHLDRHGLEQLRAFDADLEAVRAATPAGGSRNEFLPFGLEHDAHAARQWYAGLLEMAVQARLLRKLGHERVELSPRLPQGGCADASIDIGTQRIWIEISALSDDNHTIDSFDTANAVQVVHGDPYHDARRVYRKVFDKVAGKAPNLRSQIHPQEPSIVIVGDAAWRSPGADGLGFDWALGQLTDASTRHDSSGASLAAWLKHDYKDQVDEALAALDACSAVAVVSGDLALIELRVNQGVDEAHRLRNEEIENLRQLLASRPEWRR
jgi:hypothetical protein